MRNSNRDKTSTRGRTFGLTLAVVACGLSVWYFSRSPVELDSNGYDLTIALYRVCNQRDAVGLNEIENRVNELIHSDATGDRQRKALHQVIREARQENWHVAMTACRALLDAQVR